MDATLPTVSVIIPAKDAADSLPRALASIREQTYPNIIEVIVAVADRQTADSVSGALIVDNPSGTTSAGLNRAFAASTGDVIVRCDSHSRFPVGYVTRAVETLSRTGAANVGGMQTPVGNTFWEKAIAGAMTSVVGSGDARYRLGGKEGPVETVYLGVFPRATLTDLGGFDEQFARTQDYELNQRIINVGGVVWFDPALRVEYRPRGSLSGLARQYYEYGMSKRQFSRKHAGRLKLRQLTPPLIVITSGFFLLLALVNPWALAVPASYLALVSIGAIGSTLKVGSAAVGTPAAMVTMHFSWGLGFLRG